MKNLLRRDDFDPPSGEVPEEAGRVVAPSPSPSSDPSETRVPGVGRAVLRRDDFGPPLSSSSATKVRAAGRPCLDPQLQVPRHPPPARPHDPVAVARLALRPAVVKFDLPPPASEAVDHERRQREAVASSCLDSSLAASSKRTYESCLKVQVGDAEVSVGAELLPMDSDSKLMAAFSGLVGKPWATVRLVKSAVRAWHVAAECTEKFEKAWTEKALRFWQGLKRQAPHAGNAKHPVDQTELHSFLDARLAVATPAGIRDAAAAAFCFYGIRRSNEHLRLQRSQISFPPGEEGSRHATAFIAQQKNDPNGKGMTCWIPELPHLGPRCPYLLLQQWCAIWDRTWRPAFADGPLFCVTGKPGPAERSYDSWRKVLAGHFKSSAVGTHSLRKGGAHWYRTVAKVEEEVIQAQGGWCSLDTMRAAYSALTQAERREAVLAGAQKAPAPGVVHPRSSSSQGVAVASAGTESPAARTEGAPDPPTGAGGAKRFRMRKKGPVRLIDPQEWGPAQSQQS